MSGLPTMNNFRTRMTDDGILHLIFDMPGRSMNVFSNEAIHEIEAFATWLRGAEVMGVVISSGKATAFCAGADLTELAQAYEMIMAAPKAKRDRLTVDHFLPIGRAFRKLETSGKPVAAAAHGLALGGGCELFLAAHYRVVTNARETQIGLPESLVGLLPGGGGTRSMMAAINSSTPIPVFPDTLSTSSGLMPKACSISAMTTSGRAMGKSILFKTGTMVRLFSRAK